MPKFLYRVFFWGSDLRTQVLARLKKRGAKASVHHDIIAKLEAQEPGSKTKGGNGQ